MLDTTLVVSVHHRKVPLFEEGMKKLWDVGFRRIWIIESGEYKWGQYQGPAERYESVGIQNIFQSHILFWNDYKLPDNIERVMFLDNDLCLFDAQDTIEYISEFIDGDYDLATLSNYKHPRFNTKKIIEPTNFSDVHLAELHPGAIAYSIFSADLWKRMEPISEWWECRNIGFWQKMLPLDPCFGIHRMSPHTIYQTKEEMGCKTYSQFERGKWLHIGNLMKSYYDIERNFEVEGDVRRGYFCRYFPDKAKYTNKERKQYLSAWRDYMKWVGAPDGC